MIQIMNTEHTSHWRVRERVGCWKGNRRSEGNGVGGEGGEGEGGEGRRRSRKKLSLFISKDNFEWLWYNL